ncbi:MAG: GNAT family N-acetyltransferase [Acidobacteria bacterium]|nr:GNAT family N-acetyltransferase [Acidobacteriota bacterium]
MSFFSFRKAILAEARVIADLINSAYRGDSSRAGWTTEADLVMGTRINEAEICGLIEMQDSFILLCLQAKEIIGTIHLQKIDGAAYLGLFVVKPNLQGNGIGKQLMAEAEKLARQQWNVTRIWMTTIAQRSELVSFYERRGYQRTGQRKPFPTELGDNRPIVEGLQLEILEKHLSSD